MTSARCICGCTHERHVHFRPGSDCGWHGSLYCAKYRSVRTAIVLALGLTVVSLLLPISGALLTFVAVASNEYVAAGILAFVSMLAFTKYRNVTVRQWRMIFRYRAMRKVAVNDRGR